MSYSEDGAPSKAAQSGLNPKKVLYAKNGPVGYITLNRPEVLNAMDTKMHEELKAAWDDFEGDDALRVCIVTGAGDRAFSTGQDLRELSRYMEDGNAPPTIGSKGQPGWPRLTERHGLRKPVLARVKGYALGGGFELALACDIVIASVDAIFGLPEARRGLIPGAGGIFRLTRAIPTKVAMGHLMTGREMSAQRAYSLGLVNEIAPLGELDERVAHWVRDILACSPRSIESIKQIVSLSAHLSLEQAFSAEYEAEGVRRNSGDSKEGAAAFAERRWPSWRVPWPPDYETSGEANGDHCGPDPGI
jgi:enoyl-CoA hydratase/carnithine racemase